MMVVCPVRARANIKRPQRAAERLAEAQDGTKVRALRHRGRQSRGGAAASLVLRWAAHAHLRGPRRGRRRGRPEGRAAPGTSRGTPAALSGARGPGRVGASRRRLERRARQRAAPHEHGSGRACGVQGYKALHPLLACDVRCASPYITPSLHHAALATLRLLVAATAKEHACHIVHQGTDVRHHQE